MHSSTGILQYGPGIRAVVWIAEDIAKYYRSLIPKYYYVKPQMYPPHITVVRTGKETPVNMEVWGKYDGEKVPFTYNSDIATDGNYFFLDARSERIGDIREELGLPRFRFNDISKQYHITLGNVKG